MAKGFVRDVEVRLLWQLLEKDDTAKVEFRQQAQIISGTSTKFTSGQIVEQPLIVREPQTGKDLVTQIDRRTVGLSLNLRATAFADGWHIEFKKSTSSTQNRSVMLLARRVLVQSNASTLRGGRDAPGHAAPRVAFDD